MNSSNNSKTSIKNIVLVGCFDTKGEDFSYLYQCLSKENNNLITINTGVFGTTNRFPVTYEANKVAKITDVHLLDLQKGRDRGHAIQYMGTGAALIISKLLSTINLDAVIGMGGGTYMALKAMQDIPFGIPKLCISTLATKDLSTSIGCKDIVLIPSIVDVAGLNYISRTIIEQSAGALLGMIHAKKTKNQNQTNSIAISVFGNTTVCSNRCTEILKLEGFEALTFHAVGTGGQTMESLIGEGYIDAVLDITTTELADEPCGGICSAGPERLTAASKMGIPQIIVPGCLDMVNFWALNTIPIEYKIRRLFSWAPDVTLMRTNEEENEILGKQLAQKINKSKGKVIVLLPLKGLSKISAKKGGGIPELDNILFSSLKKNLNTTVDVIEIDANINTPYFAEQAVKWLFNLLDYKHSID